MEAMNWLLHCPQIDFESLYFDSKIAQIAETSEHMGAKVCTSMKYVSSV